MMRLASTPSRTFLQLGKAARGMTSLNIASGGNQVILEVLKLEPPREVSKLYAPREFSWQSCCE
jgi:hypothetical protein